MSIFRLQEWYVYRISKVLKFYESESHDCIKYGSLKLEMSYFKMNFAEFSRNINTLLFYYISKFSRLSYLTFYVDRKVIDLSPVFLVAIHPQLLYNADTLLWASEVPSLQFGDLTNEADGSRSVLWLSLYGITFIVSTCSITLGLKPTPSWSITRCFQPMTTRSHHTTISFLGVAFTQLQFVKDPI